MTPARARTRAAWPGDECTNHEAIPAPFYPKWPNWIEMFFCLFVCFFIVVNAHKVDRNVSETERNKCFKLTYLFSSRKTPNWVEADQWANLQVHCMAKELNYMYLNNRFYQMKNNRSWTCVLQISSQVPFSTQPHYILN